MITDNQWHDGIVVKHLDGGYGIYEDWDDVEKNGAAKIGEESQWNSAGLEPEWGAVKYNWNQGQPIVDFGTFKASIVDISLTKK